MFLVTRIHTCLKTNSSKRFMIKTNRSISGCWRTFGLWVLLQTVLQFILILYKLYNFSLQYQNTLIAIKALVLVTVVQEKISFFPASKFSSPKGWPFQSSGAPAVEASVHCPAHGAIARAYTHTHTVHTHTYTHIHIHMRAHTHRTQHMIKELHKPQPEAQTF